MTAAEQLDDVLTNALGYANLGWRVIPIRPGEKRPPMTAWQNAATTDTDTITNWWTGLYRGHGIGIATGPESGIWVLDVDTANGKTGDDTLTDLQDAYGPLPDTVEAITGSGGRHLYYRWPDHIDIRNNQSGALGPGLDIRGAGGQVVASPTIHANGQRYSWVDGHEPDIMPVADAPRWLLALLDQPEVDTPHATPTQPNHTDPDDGPAARFNQATTWTELLTNDGWTLHHTDRDGEQHWTRPGKHPREGTSATVGYRGNDALKVFTSSVPGLEADRAYSRFGYLAATRHAGDRSACARALINAGYGRPHQPPDLTWITDQADDELEDPTPAPLEIRWVDDLDHGAMPPEPPELVHGLLRRGEMCVFGAPRAIGKTWLAYNLAIQLARGEGQFLGNLDIVRQANVLYLQGELDQWGSATRWKLLTGAAAPLPHVAETFDRLRFRTVKRRITYTSPNGHTGTEEYVDAHIDDRLEQAILDYDIDVVIVDPWAVYLAGAENSNDDVEAVLGALREITLRTGVAWVIIHHITGKAERSSWTEPEDLWRGATRLADWASTRVTVLPHYTEAQYRELGLTRREARRHANVHFLRRSTPTDDFTMRLDEGWWTAWTPDDDPPGTTPLLRLARALTDNGGQLGSIAEVATTLGISHATAKKHIDDALDAGLITTRPGERGATTVELADVDHPWANRVRPRDDLATTSRREVREVDREVDWNTESVSDQEKRDSGDTSPRDDLATTPRGAKPQVKCGEAPPRDPPPPTEGGPPEADHPPTRSNSWLLD